VRFGDLDDGLVSRDRRAIREKIETESKIRKWFQDLMLVALTVVVSLIAFFLAARVLRRMAGHRPLESYRW
jgi:hypothetical protein